MFKVREMSNEDLNYVADISLAAFGKRDIENFTKVVKDPNYKYFICENEYKIILGYIGLLAIDETAEIITLAVDGNFRHRGIGTLLMEFAIEYLKRNKHLAIVLEVRRDNKNACSLYQKFEFIPISIRKNYYEGSTDAIIMKKQL